MMIATGEQARSRGRAQRGGVKVREPQARAGQAVEGRRGNVGAVATELRIADVVEQHDHDVRRTLGWIRQGRPPGCRLRERAADDTLEALAGRHRPPSPVGRQPRLRERRAPDATAQCRGESPGGVVNVTSTASSPDAASPSSKRCNAFAIRTARAFAASATGPSKCASTVSTKSSTHRS